jgi:hypothetical protein
MQVPLEQALSVVFADPLFGEASAPHCAGGPDNASADGEVSLRERIVPPSFRALAGTAAEARSIQSPSGS